MKSGYLRLLRSKSSFEPGQDVADLIRKEFWDSEKSIPDLNLSVFEVNIEERLLQTNAEFAAGNDLGIPSKRKGLDVSIYASGWSVVIATPTTNELMDFHFSSSVHRELQFLSDAELNIFVKDLQAAVKNVSIPEVRDKATARYGNERYLAKDKEWEQVCDLSEQVAKWVKTGKP
jgi:hypothetical protein